MRTRWWVALFVCALLIASAAANALAETFLVYKIDAIQFEEGTDVTVTQLLRSELAKQPGTSALLAPLDSPCADVSCAQKEIETAGVDAIVVGLLRKLGDKAILIVDVVRKDGVQSYTVSLENLGELDRIMPRLAVAIVQKKTFEEVITVETVSKKEEELHRRIKGDFSWGPSLGIIVPTASSYGDANQLFSITVPFRYEISKFAVSFETGVYFEVTDEEGHSIGEWPLDIIGMYYFSKGSHTPFVGTSFGLHYIQINREMTEEERERWEEKMWECQNRYLFTGEECPEKPEEHWSAWAVQISAFGGWEFMRTHTTHLAGRVGYRYTFAELDGDGAQGLFFDLALTF